MLTEKSFSHGDIILCAIPIGGLRMIDGNEADDKIVAVLEGDAVYGGWREIAESPPALIDRLRHYFLTYKQVPGATDAAGRDRRRLRSRRSVRSDPPQPRRLRGALRRS